MIKRLIPVLGFVIITAAFFWQFLFKGLLPIPADTIVGLYHPYRDAYAKDYPNGIPFKNFLITDPVRQQYPWKTLSIDSYKKLNLPTWNSYSFSGTPNLANFQSAVFYPFNILFFIIPFEISWSFFILLQPLLAAIFMFYFLKNLKLDDYSSFLGGLVFAFSGFFVMWLEWGTVLHTAIWLPLILLSTDKISANLNNRKKILTWSGILIFAVASSLFAGHLQIFFYLIIFSLIYVLARIWQSKKKGKLSIVLFLSFAISLVITLPQLVPTLKFISLSGRELDQLVWQKEGWFVPIQQLIQFIIPDFFGNPTTLNYWGTWNYGELTGFAGIVAIVLSIFAVLFRRDKKTIFFFTVVIISIFFAVSNPISKIPFILSIPFISTAQPTRLLFLTGFSISVLAALGLNYLILKGRLKQIIIPLIMIGIVFVLTFIFLQLQINNNSNVVNYLVAKRNMIFPVAIFGACSFILISYLLINKKFKKYLLLLLMVLVVIELFRFSWKFNTFSKKEYLYPETSSIKFLEKNIGNFRIATTDSRVLAPNFSIMHGLSSVEGYDPLYIERYAELIAAINRNEPNIKPPFGFNRIIRIENFSSNLVDLMGVKYVLSLSDMNVAGYEKVFEEGQTKIYENDEVLPRTFFVKELKFAQNKNDVIKMMFDPDFIPIDQAVVEEKVNEDFSKGKANVAKYSNEEIIIETENKGIGFLVLTDTFYPSWRARINGRAVKIYKTDFNFRGVIVPPGKNEVVFKNSLL